MPRTSKAKSAPVALSSPPKLGIKLKTVQSVVLGRVVLSKWLEFDEDGIILQKPILTNSVLSPLSFTFPYSEMNVIHISGRVDEDGSYMFIELLPGFIDNFANLYNLEQVTGKFPLRLRFCTADHDQFNQVLACIESKLHIYEFIVEPMRLTYAQDKFANDVPHLTESVFFKPVSEEPILSFSMLADEERHREPKQSKRIRTHSRPMSVEDQAKETVDYQRPRSEQGHAKEQLTPLSLNARAASIEGQCRPLFMVNSVPLQLPIENRLSTPPANDFTDSARSNSRAETLPHNSPYLSLLNQTRTSRVPIMTSTPNIIAPARPFAMPQPSLSPAAMELLVINCQPSTSRMSEDDRPSRTRTPVSYREAKVVMSEEESDASESDTSRMQENAKVAVSDDDSNESDEDQSDEDKSEDDDSDEEEVDNNKGKQEREQVDDDDSDSDYEVGKSERKQLKGSNKRTPGIKRTPGTRRTPTVKKIDRSKIAGKPLFTFAGKVYDNEEELNKEIHLYHQNILLNFRNASGSDDDLKVPYCCYSNLVGHEKCEVEVNTVPKFMIHIVKTRSLLTECPNRPMCQYKSYGRLFDFKSHLQKCNKKLTD